MYEKRERGKNFTDGDKYIMLTLVEGYINIIENKKTDNLSTLQKKKAWQEIEGKFNLVTKNEQRQWDRLKTLYENLKATARNKKKTAEKEEISKPGAGATKITLNGIDKKILSLLDRHYNSNNIPASNVSNDDLSFTDDYNEVKTEPSTSAPQSPGFYSDPFHIVDSEDFLAENNILQRNEEACENELSQEKGDNAEMHNPQTDTPAKKRKQEPINSKERYYNRLLEMAEEKHQTEMEILKLVKRKEELEVLIKTNQAQKNGIL